MKVHVLHVPGVVPERDENVQLLKRTFEVCMHEDPERNGVMLNWLSAVDCALADDGDNGWSTIVQDDAMPFERTELMLRQAQWYSPAPVLGLSYFGDPFASAAKRGIPYVVGPHLIWGAAVTYRQDFLDGILPWAREIYEATGYTHDDRLISAYAQKIGSYTAVTTRALFDQPVEQSLLGHGGAGSIRRPARTIENTAGPGYGAKPSSVWRETGGAKDQRDWLAVVGTPAEAELGYHFELIRHGAVRRVDH